MSVRRLRLTASLVALGEEEKMEEVRASGLESGPRR